MRSLALIKHQVLEIRNGTKLTSHKLPQDMPELLIYELTGKRVDDLVIPFHAFLFDSPGTNINQYRTELVIKNMEEVIERRNDVMNRRPKFDAGQSKPSKIITKSITIDTGQRHDAYEPIHVAQMMNLSVQTVRKKLRAHNIPKPYKWKNIDKIIEKLRK